MPVPGKMWRFLRRGGIITQESVMIGKSHAQTYPIPDPICFVTGQLLQPGFGACDSHTFTHRNTNPGSVYAHAYTSSLPHRDAATHLHAGTARLPKTA